MDESEERKSTTDSDKNTKGNELADAFSVEDLFKSDRQIFSQITQQNLINPELAKSFSKAAVDLKSGVIDFSPTQERAKEGGADAKAGVKAEARDGARDKADTKDGGNDAAKDGARKVASADRISRKDLEESAGKNLKDEAQRSAFLKNVEAFESRADKDKLPNEEKERFYAQVRDVLDASKTGNKNFDSAYLQTIASDMMKEAAKPGSVNQGSYGTCTAAALQSALFKAEPATIGGFVRDLALTGEYKTVDGSLIKPSEKNLKPDKYHKEETPYSRNSVDQLSQIGLLNTFWQRQAGLENDDKKLLGKIKYEEGHVRDHISDDRTRLMDYSKETPQAITMEVSTSDPGSKVDTSQFAGATENRPVSGPRILDMANINDMYNQLRGNKGNLKVISGGGSDPVFKPKSEEELKDFIEKARKDNNGVLPAMVLGVHTNVEPFKADLKDAFYSKEKSDKGGRDPGEIHGHHAVALFDFDSKTNKTKIENQWGDNVDHTGEKGSKPQVDLKDIFKAIKGEAEPKQDKNDKQGEVPEKFDREKNAKNYIDEYKKFVRELEGDSDADPKKVLQNQIKLNDYFKSWERKEESKEQLKEIGAHLGKFLPDMNLNEAADVYSTLAKDFKANGMDNKINELDAGLDLKLKNTMKDLGDKNTTFRKQNEILNSVGSVLKAFKDTDNNKAIERTVKTLVSTADEIRKENGVSDKKSIEITKSVLQTLQKMGSDKEADALFKSTLSAIKEAETAARGDKSVAANAKIEMAQISRDNGKTELSNKLYGELEETYKELKANGAPSGSKTVRSDLLQALMFQNREAKNGDKLEPLVADWVKDVKGMIAKDNSTTERKDDWRASMLEHAGEALDEVKRPAQALKYYNEALESARKLKDDQHMGQKIALKAIDCCKQLGKKEEAEALAKEFKLEKWLR